MKSLIAKLEQASEGSDELDREIAEKCGIQWSPDEDGQFGGYNILPRRCHFSRSLDSKLPEENITQVALHDVIEGEPMMGTVWEAWHTDPETGHQTMGAGHTEALARRIASLKARA